MRVAKVVKSLLLLIVVIASGCVKDPHPTHPMDPYEQYNRRVFAFNLALDKGVVRPVTIVYHSMVPPPLRKGLQNAFSNVGEINSLINHLLQGNLKNGLVNANRFVVNTVFGLGGLFDVASYLGLQPARTSFDRTLELWGAKPKYYLMLPFLGPVTDRGLVAMAIDRIPFSPYSYLDNRYLSCGLVVGNYIQLRDSNTAATEIVYNAFDPYVLMRDALLQNLLTVPTDANNANNVSSHQSHEVNSNEHFEYVLD